MEYNDLTKVIWDMTAAIVDDMVRKPAAKYIRYKYPVDGKPDSRTVCRKMVESLGFDIAL